MARAVGVLNGNWKTHWQDELQTESVRLPLRREIEIALKVAESMMVQDFPSIVEQGTKRAEELREQLRILANITREAQEEYFANLSAANEPSP